MKQAIAGFAFLLVCGLAIWLVSSRDKTATDTLKANPPTTRHSRPGATEYPEPEPEPEPERTTPTPASTTTTPRLPRKEPEGAPPKAGDKLIRDIYPQSAACWWTFDKYLPSNYEVEWAAATEPKDRFPCKRFPLAVAQNWTNYWKEYHDNSLCTSNSGCPPIELKSIGKKPTPPDFFSKSQYRKVCDSAASSSPSLFFPAPRDGPDTYQMVIEPLVGPLRHPLYCTNPGYLLSKDYLFFSDPWLIQPMVSESVRFFYFDAGASTWSTGAGGASQSWIVTEFTNRWCMMQSGIWAWEITQQEPTTVFGQLPYCLPPVYHWFNVPVSSDVSNSQNIWRHLEAVARPEDFVLVKIDIDTPIIENKLVKELLETPKVQRLVDEMFYEHHVNFEPICAPWALCNDFTLFYKDSLNLFSSLRKLGIRVHSWV